MTDTNVLKLVQPGTFSDLLTDVLRSGAHALLAQAVEAEVASFLAANAHLQTEDGRQRLVRHGHLPERRVATGIGAVTVRQPRVRDRGQPGEPPIRFSPAILPPYARRTKSLEVLIPILHLKGVGRIYQQTFIDTYTKVSFAKLYDRKTPITAADLLNDRVLPFFEDCRGRSCCST